MIILLYRVSWKWTSKKTGKILKIIKSWRATAFLKIYKKLKRMSKNENRIHLIHAKSPRTCSTGASSLTGNNLSSQAASSPVLSTRESLTAVFGMGTGGTSQPSSPDRWTVFLCSRCVKTASRLLHIPWYAFAALAGLSLRPPQKSWFMECAFQDSASLHNPWKSSFILQVFPDLQNFTEETTHFLTRPHSHS